MHRSWLILVFCLPGCLWATTKPILVTMNVEQVPIHTVLQSLAELAQKDMIISVNVRGDISVHLRDMPWQQALKIILHSHNLVQQDVAGVIFIADADTLYQQQTQQLKLQDELEKLKPLETRLFNIHYGQAKTYYDMLNDPKQTLLSKRGRVVTLKDNNILIIEDTQDKLDALITLFKQLDKPVKQVSIAARVAFMSQSLARELGVKWQIGKVNEGKIQDGFNMDLGTEAVAGKKPATLALGFVSQDFLLDLELSALEMQGDAEVISSPHIITANNVMAVIEQGTQIAYPASAENGGTTVQLVPATLKLEVTPHIMPHDNIRLDVLIKQDRPGIATSGSLPPIETRLIRTNVSMKNQQTIVLGGVYEYDQSNVIHRVPLLSAIPLLGKLFQSQTKNHRKSELLIFITPTIVKEL